MRRTQAGFTLVELMISVLISSLLVVMLLTLFGRLSVGYREQQGKVRLQQTLSAARTALEHDARQAGLFVAQGFTIASDVGKRYSPIRVWNRDDGPDELAFYYADPSAQASVLATPAPTAVTLTVDDASEFAVGDLVVLTTPDTTTMPNPISGFDANIVTFAACVLRIDGIAGTEVTFETGGDWGNPTNSHCTNITGGTTLMYRFVAHHWRIDPTRPELAALQLDATGSLVPGTFTDQAYDVTDLQAATYFYDGDGVDTADPDSDGNRDWSSGDAQETLTAPIAIGTQFTAPLMMTLSVVVRSTATVEGVYTTSSPELADPANLAHNMIGDRVSVTLPSATDPLLAGTRLYRHATFRVDLRNIGVGR